MKINMPNKALSHKILCGAALLMFSLKAPGDSHPQLGEEGVFCLVYGCSCSFTPIKRELERGLAIGLGRTKSSARAAARKHVPKDGVTYGVPTYIKNPNNTYTCYIKWRWVHETSFRPAK